MQNAIPEHSEANRAMAKGNNDIITIVTANQIIKVRCVPIGIISEK